MKRLFKYPESYNGLTFNKESLQERFDKIDNEEGIDVYDSYHAIEQFSDRFPKLSIQRYYDTLHKGLRKIADKYDYEQNQYVIMSRKYRIKIPIQIRPDEKKPDILIGVTPSTLDMDEHPVNTRNEIEILVEKTKKEKSHIWLNEFTENQVGKIDSQWFMTFIENGNISKEFEEILID